ncbi:catechol 2,3-dioxygenase [Roseinatronobacter thiooxidans]|uniref:Catechol 2,3-dioxygenase n=1 Tax=Roseinatronobacter thiooxidans TaxID=121821 RepID=A0A2W7Q0X9_9RHOB|nr:VOC family protein [Roseinatronobacter thiooxidans]PZX42224.1 catechol 2,3-dioxygenase [Roseinatronobacter thiooxidans]
MTDVFFNHATALLRIGRARLRVRDLSRVSKFYQRVLGLAVIDQSADAITLGTGTVPLLELSGDPSATPRNPRDAGIFHTAFLLPTRAELACWLAYADTLGVRLQGASDHIVSEAIYLADPEGNGIEVDSDRPVSHWRDTDGQIRMATEPMNIPDLMRARQGDWAGFPVGGTIGHVHLQVGDVGVAENFYRDIFGFDIASRYPGASFFGSGGYHHHLAGNIWSSRRAEPRPEGAAGLDLIEISVRDPDLRSAILASAVSAGINVNHHGDTFVLPDPWGTVFALKS